MSQSAPQEMASDSWAGEQGEKWNTYRDQFEGMIEAAGRAVVAHAGFTAGERVIDIGCGAGITSLWIAGIVGDAGQVTGLDLSPTLIATCKARAKQAGLGNIDFVTADAATASPGTFDHLFSRFGVMFFEDPVAAFRNMRGFIKPGGKVTFACWGPPPQNPWVFDLMAIVARHVELPPPVPNAPGPFAFADPAYLEGILQQGGYGSITLTSWSGDQLLGGPGASPEEATDFLMEATFLGRAIDGQPAEKQARILGEITERLRTFRTEAGVPVKGTVWLVSART